MITNYVEEKIRSGDIMTPRRFHRRLNSQFLVYKSEDVLRLAKTEEKLNAIVNDVTYA